MFHLVGEPITPELPEIILDIIINCKRNSLFINNFSNLDTPADLTQDLSPGIIRGPR